MANSENAKLKILLLYDYFLHDVGPTSETGVTVQEIIDLLEDELNTKFERKSIYADISRINEFITLKGACDVDFIARDGKHYIRGLLKDEIMLEEAKMISDSLRTTEFISDELCRKFEAMFPAYFEHEESAYVGRLYSRHINRDSVSSRRQLINTQNILVSIRTSMEKKKPLVIRYGYTGGESKVYSSYVLTPLKIDWTNSHYYLIAIDHLDLFTRIGFDKTPSDNDLSESIKRFRLDRVLFESPSDNTYISCKDNLNFIEQKLPAHYEELFGTARPRVKKPEMREMAAQYLDFQKFSSEDAQEKVIDAYIKRSLDAFSSEKTPVKVRLSIEADSKCTTVKDPWKQVLVAFSAIKDEFDVKEIREIKNDGVQKISFTIITPLSKTLYKHLFSIYTMDGVIFRIDNDDIKQEMLAYADKIRRMIEDGQ